MLNRTEPLPKPALIVMTIREAELLHFDVPFVPSTRRGRPPRV